MKKQTASFKNT